MDEKLFEIQGNEVSFDYDCLKNIFHRILETYTSLVFRSMLRRIDF